jgi:glycosyltransferase involved in cell wall biosynthesis
MAFLKEVGALREAGVRVDGNLFVSNRAQVILPYHRMIELAAAMGIGQHVTFTGFLRGNDIDEIFKMADLYVMPSVSEPFGLAPLEALTHDVPVLISKQSGVSEVLTHALKVDFWDINEMANKIIAVLRHPPLQKTLREHGAFEVRKFVWTDAAKLCNDVYQEAFEERR